MCPVLPVLRAQVIAQVMTGGGGGGGGGLIDGW